VTLFVLLALQYPYSNNADAVITDRWRPAMEAGRVRWAEVSGKLGGGGGGGGMDLLRSMLVHDPSLRFTAAQCLAHRWFDDIRTEVKTVFRDDTLLSLRR
jgi:serine/threonine protein kinase